MRTNTVFSISIWAGLIFKDCFTAKQFLFKKTDDFSFRITAIANLLSLNYNFADSYPKRSYGDTKAIRQLLFWHADLIENCLPSVLNGNFSWYEEQKNADLYERKLVRVILGVHIGRDHPISQKFRTGDKS